MSADQKAFLLDHLQESGTAFEHSVTGVDAASWFRAPGEDRWSIGQCAEHVVTVEGRIRGLLERLSQMPEEPFEPADMERKDQMVLGVATRQERVQAPPVLHPSSKYATSEDALDQFRQTHEDLVRLAAEFPEWLRGRFVEHPILKKLDGYQWLLACSCHAVRHTAQIEEIKQQLGK